MPSIFVWAPQPLQPYMSVQIVPQYARPEDDTAQHHLTLKLLLPLPALPHPRKPLPPPLPPLPPPAPARCD